MVSCACMVPRVAPADLALCDGLECGHEHRRPDGLQWANSEKWILQGRGKSYQIDVLDSSTAHMVTFIIPPQKYNSLSEGDIFTAEFIRGGFGIPYRWRIGSQSERNKLPD